MNQQDLFLELQGLRRSLVKYFALLPARSQDWRPQENMFSLWELATHLAQIPAVDTAICKEATQPEIAALQERLSADTPEALLAIWDQGVEDAINHFEPMSAEEFESTETTAFYGHKMPAKGWLMEIVTHTYHHRAMLHIYLKLQGKPVDMSYVYA